MPMKIVPHLLRFIGMVFLTVNGIIASYPQLPFVAYIVVGIFSAVGVSLIELAYTMARR